MAPAKLQNGPPRAPGGKNGVSVPSMGLHYNFPGALVEERIANERTATEKIAELWLHGISIDAEAFERFADMPQLTNYAGVFTALVEFADILIARGVGRISTNATRSYFDERPEPGEPKTYYISEADFSAEGIRMLVRNEGNKLPEHMRARSAERQVNCTVAPQLAALTDAQRARFASETQIALVNAPDRGGASVGKLNGVARQGGVARSNGATGRAPASRVPAAADKELRLKGNRMYVAQMVLNAKFPGKGFKVEKLTDDYTQFKVMNASGEYAGYTIVVSQNPPFTATLVGKEVRGGKWVTVSRENFIYAGGRAVTKKGPLAELLGTPG